jgi:hypothetical protein
MKRGTLDDTSLSARAVLDLVPLSHRSRTQPYSLTMGVLDTLRFSEKKYREKHSKWSDRDLIKKHHEKVMIHTMNAGGATAGVLGAAATGGVSLLQTAYSARQMSVVKQQRKILEQILQDRGVGKPRKRTRDKLGGVALAAVSAGIGAGIGEVRTAFDSQLERFANVEICSFVVGCLGWHV